MMTPRLKTVKTAIHHVRNPSERMPVGGVHRLERPNQPFCGKPLANMKVLMQILLVVVHKVIAKSWGKDDKRSNQ